MFFFGLTNRVGTDPWLMQCIASSSCMATYNVRDSGGPCAALELSGAKYAIGTRDRATGDRGTDSAKRLQNAHVPRHYLQGPQEACRADQILLYAWSRSPASKLNLQCSSKPPLGNKMAPQNPRNAAQNLLSAAPGTSKCRLYFYTGASLHFPSPLSLSS